MANPFQRIASFFRRKPGRIGTPPSARRIPADPAMHARDFSRRYTRDIDLAVSRRMLDLGIDPDQIGMPDRAAGNRHAAFHPDVPDGGNVAPDGRIIVGSGLFNLELL